MEMCVTTSRVLSSCDNKGRFLCSPPPHQRLVTVSRDRINVVEVTKLFSCDHKICTLWSRKNNKPLKSFNHLRVAVYFSAVVLTDTLSNKSALIKIVFLFLRACWLVERCLSSLPIIPLSCSNSWPQMFLSHGFKGKWSLQIRGSSETHLR